MAELKCIEIGRPNEAQYIDEGSSYCQAHYWKEQEQRLPVRWVYIVGLLLWTGIWFWVFGVAGPRPTWLVDKVLKLYK
ncbi:hypothetical protein EPO44_04150 [bacterium]|nr:MAG: hypothetical protein EPO44_04150 [bacterium]